MSQQSVHTLFRTELTNTVDATDFEPTDNGFVLVGRILLFLPPVLARPTLSLEQLQDSAKQDSLSESSLDDSDFVQNALILTIRRDGKLLGDKVIHDARNGYLMGVARRGVGRYVASGSASYRGWVLEFSAVTN
jgi:hypothetical protein